MKKRLEEALMQLRNNDRSVKELNLRGNGIGDTDAQKLSTAFKNNTNLINLNLSFNNISAIGIKDLSGALKINTSLTKLSLQGNKFGAAGTKDLSTMLKSNTCFIKLNLGSNQIRDAGAKDISEALRNNTSLINLNLSFNDISDIGVKDLSTAIKSNTGLSEINLKYNNISDIGAKDLSQMLKTNTSLTKLNLSHNAIGSKGISYLAQALQSNYTLLKLKGIDNDAIKKLLARNKLIASCLPQGLNNQDRMALITKLKTLLPSYQLPDYRYRANVYRLLISLGYQPNKIPPKIHLFWTGSVIPDVAVKNIISFLKNLPNPEWKVYVWLTNENHFYKSTFFNAIEKNDIPSSLIIKNINELLNSDVFYQLKEAFILENCMFPFSHVKEIITRELIGLGNPAAAKDGLAPLILFSEGGYFFDLDYQANSTLTPHRAPHGFLILNRGRIVSALAAEKGHSFCAYALTSLVASYQTLSSQTQEKPSQYETLHSKKFFECQVLRDRKNVNRTTLTINTSGSIIDKAYAHYIFRNKTCPDEKATRQFVTDTHFESADDVTLSMGITPYLKQTGDWRKPKKIRFFDDLNLPESNYSWVDVNSSANQKLRSACQRGRLDKVRILLLNPFIDVNAANKDEETPLYLACTQGHENIVNMLVKQPLIDINKAEYEGVTPLYIACQKGYVNIVNLLLEQPTLRSINQVGLKNHTPLLVACLSPDTMNKDELFHALLKKGASLFHKNDIGQTALDIAFATHNQSAMSTILKFAKAQEISLHLIMSSDTMKVATDWMNKHAVEVEDIRAAKFGL